MVGCCRDLFVPCAVLLMSVGGCSSRHEPKLPVWLFEESSSTSGGTTGVMAAMSDGNTPAGNTTGSASRTGTGPTDTGPTDTGPTGYPNIAISGGELFDFGSQDIHGTAEHVFVITNEGDGKATNLQVAVLGEAFSQQNSYCGSVLAPAAICAVEVIFAPELFGAYTGQLEITFDDAGTPDSIVQNFEGLGIGATPNLLVNGNGEEGLVTTEPPIGWSAERYGHDWSISQEATPFAGDYSIHADNVSSLNYWIYQAVSASSITTWGDLVGVRFRSRAFHRAVDPLFCTSVGFSYLDGDGQSVDGLSSGLHCSPTWLESTGEVEAPANSQSVRFVIGCPPKGLPVCEGFFDEVELVAEWSG